MPFSPHFGWPRLEDLGDFRILVNCRLVIGRGTGGGRKIISSFELLFPQHIQHFLTQGFIIATPFPEDISQLGIRLLGVRQQQLAQGRQAGQRPGGYPSGRCWRRVWACCSTWQLGA
jgi:hypothetical protein